MQWQEWREEKENKRLVVVVVVAVCVFVWNGLGHQAKLNQTKPNQT